MELVKLCRKQSQQFFCAERMQIPGKSQLAQDIGMDYGRWYLEHMFVIAPATDYVGQWLQSFKEFPPRQKPGSFNLDRVMEQVMKNNKN